jgi:DNA-binding response OmpR family regulator
MPRVLIVDDDTLIGMLLAAMLQDMGFEACAVETTESGAVAAALRLRPDLMLVDAKLGPGSGIAAMAEIGLQMAVPHIFMSGERLARESYGAPTLLKPFSEQQLAGAIRRVLAVPAAAVG